MDEIEFKLLTEKGYYITNNPSIDISFSLLKDALRVELVRNFNIIIDEKNYWITENIAVEIFDFLKKKGILKTQPFYPEKIIPVSVTSGGIRYLSNKNKKVIIGVIKQESEFMREIINKKYPSKTELMWMSKNLEITDHLLFDFLSKHLIKGKIRATRSDRRIFMDKLEKQKDLKLTEININYWKKLALWIHPSDFSDKYPKASQHLFSVLQGIKKKQKPENQKLKNLMWKGWRKGNEFEVFESFLDNPNLSIRDVLISIRDFERDPRVSRWKNTCGGSITLGKQEPGIEEQEIVDLIQIQLKKKLLELIKPEDKTVSITPFFYDVSVSELLNKYNPVQYKEEGASSVIITTANEGYSFLIYYLKDGNRRTIGHLQQITLDLSKINESFYLIGFSAVGDKNNEFEVSLFNNCKRLIKKNRILISEDSNTLILFEYDNDTKTFKWIGKPSKTFYAGSPNFIEDWGKVKEVLDRKPIISIGELAEEMYTKVNNGKNILDFKSIKKDLGL